MANDIIYKLLSK